MYARYGKRFLDIAVSLVGIAILLPVFAVAAIAVFAEDRGSPFFVQDRVGQKEGSFRLIKFRSMPIGTATRASPDAAGLRVTRVGRVLRRTNLDELPQLFNVFLGEMTLVGPRPALLGQTELLALRKRSGADQARPGLTGLAQVSAYDGMPLNEKAGLDGRYAAGISFLNDLRIIGRTLPYLLRRPPVY
jgi:O-antigen biosynthesis protein WbqP